MLDNLAYFKDWVQKTDKISCVFPNGVSTSFVKLETKKSSLEFCKDLLKDTGVLLVPGEAFDTPGYARLGYCAPHETLTKGLEVLGDYLQAN